MTEKAWDCSDFNIASCTIVKASPLAKGVELGLYVLPVVSGIHV